MWGLREDGSRSASRPGSGLFWALDARSEAQQRRNLRQLCDMLPFQLPISLLLMPVSQELEAARVCGPMLCRRGDIRSSRGESSPAVTPSVPMMLCADSECRKRTIFSTGRTLFLHNHNNNLQSVIDSAFNPRHCKQTSHFYTAIQPIN